MDKKERHRYIYDLISLVQERKSLWDHMDENYEIEEIVNQYWSEVALRLRLAYKSDDITVESCKSVWSQLMRLYRKKEKNFTVISFDYFDRMCLLLASSFFISLPKDRLLERTQGKYLLILHLIIIIASVLVFIFMQMQECFAVEASPTPVLITVCIMFIYTLVIHIPLHSITNVYRSSTVVVVSFVGVVVCMLISILLVATPLPTAPKEAWKNWWTPYTFMFFLMVFEQESWRFHSLKIIRPIMLIEHTLQITCLLATAFSFLLLISNFDWNVYYLFFPTIMLLISLIMGCYAYVLQSNSIKYPYERIVVYKLEAESPQKPFSLLLVEDMEAVNSWY